MGSRWQVTLPPTAATPAPILISISANDAGISQLNLTDVLVGDVFLCAGQSNMALFGEVSYSAKTLQAQMQRGRYANIHYFQFEDMSGGRIGAGGSYTPAK